MNDILITVYQTLRTHYGNLHWWPAETPYEVIVGAVLTQNTAWSNVEKAIANFGEKLSPEFVLNADTKELAEIIRPSGFFNQKLMYLAAITEWFKNYGYDVQSIRCEPFDKIRNELLSIKGIGNETADSILLYAFGFPTFVVDAYTIRFCERFPIEVQKEYNAVKIYFENNLPQDEEVYNNFHALLVVNAKQHCRKKSLCNECPIFDICQRCSV